MGFNSVFEGLKLIVEFVVVFINPKERFENCPFPSKTIHPTKWHVTSVCLRAPACTGNNHMINTQSSCLWCNLWSFRLRNLFFFLARRESTNLLQEFMTLIISFWRVNVLYFVGIGSQPEKTWRHRELTAPEVVVRNHGNGGINNNMAARKPETTIIMATAIWRTKQQHGR